MDTSRRMWSKSSKMWRIIASDMDALDLRIVEALQHQGDLTHSELAERVNSTPSTCLRRVRQLKKSGVLVANIYLVSAARVGRPIHAIVTVTTKDHKRDGRQKMASCVLSEPSIAYAHEVTGDLDVILICNFKDIEEYQEVCDRLVDQVEDIVRLSTHFVSNTYKTETAMPLDVIRDPT